MTLYNKAFFTSRHTWPSELAQALPELLGELLKQHQPPSLERMQLVRIDLKLLDTGNNKTGALWWSKKSLIKKPDQFLTLSGTLHKDNNPLLEITIDYFLRGQRQFFRQTAPLDLSDTRVISAITTDDVSSFFTTLGQGNEFFLDTQLARLNGLAFPPVPNQMLLAMLISHALVELPQAQLFCLYFYQALPQEKPLRLVSRCNEHAYTLGVSTAEGIAASIVVSK